MATADTIEYEIQYPNGEQIYRQNEPLLSYKPACNYYILPYWYDENGEYHEGKRVRLDTFLDIESKENDI